MRNHHFKFHPACPAERIGKDPLPHRGEERNFIGGGEFFARGGEGKTFIGSGVLVAKGRKPKNVIGSRALPVLMNWGKAESGVRRATLPNGLRMIVIRDTLAPVVTVVTNYLVGSNESPAGFPGMAHAQEHMLFRGSRGLSGDQLAAILASLGGAFDADTQPAVTQYFLTVPSQDLSLALRVESIRMRGVFDSDNLWRRERGAIEQEVAEDLSDPEYVLYRRLLAAIFQGTPLAHDALGTRESFERTSGAAVKRFYHDWYAPNNAVLVIAGDIDPQKTLSKVTALFGSIPPKEIPARPGIRLAPLRAEDLNLKTDLSYGLALICFRMPGYDSGDFAAAEILSDVLSSQRGTLYSLVPQGKALFADFALDPFRAAGWGYAEAGFPKGADGKAILRQIRQILENDRVHGLPAGLVSAAKRSELVDAEFRKNSISGLASAWSQAVAVEGRTSPAEDLGAIRRVTVQDVNRVARKYLISGPAITAILTPQSAGHPVAGKRLRGRESFAPENLVPVTLPSWAEAALSRLAVPAPMLHPVVSLLPNGIKLIVQTEQISDTASVFGEIDSNPDLEESKSQEGVDDVLDQLFAYGSATLDRLQFQKALDEIGADESAGTEFSVQIPANQFDRGVQLLADNELHPALPQSAFKVIQKQSAATVAGELESPGHLAGRAFRAALLPRGDPALRHATPVSIQRLTLRDVKRYYGKVFRPDMTTIVVVGNLTPETARQAIEKYFGSWKASGAKPETVLPPVPLSRPSLAAVPDASRIQDSVTLGETLGLNRFDPSYYALVLGNHVLGGGFYATRLYKDLREGNSLVYFVDASLDARRTRATYEVDYGCDPRNVSRVRAIIVRDLKAMQQSLVTPRELRLAKSMLLREIPLSESSLEGIANGWLDRSDLGLPLNEPELAARRYLYLSAEDVRAAFARWVRPDDFVQVTQGPKPQ